MQEHHFTIPQIKEILDELGLAFMGFEFLDKRIMKALKIANQEDEAIHDLGKWHEYEILNPRLFARMYQFWAQKLQLYHIAKLKFY